MTVERFLALQRELARRSRPLMPPHAYCPQEPTERQRAFLACDTEEAAYGGAAGGGKSSALLMAALQWVHVPQYAALLVRRTYADLALPGALMDRAAQWLTGTDAVWHAQDRRWRFPSGATLSFGYLETDQDRYRYQGSELQYVGIDEATQLSETAALYLRSRIRRLSDSVVPLRYRLATNPGGVGHEWVWRRYVAPDAQWPFVPARLDDNRHIDRASYQRTLAALDATTRAQLLDGQWIRDPANRVYHWSRECLIDRVPDYGMSAVIGVDLGASQSKPTTALVTCVWSDEGPYVYVARARACVTPSPSDVALEVRSMADWCAARGWRVQACVVDAGGLGGGYVEELRRRHGLGVMPAEKRDKPGYRRLLNGALQRGELRIVDTDDTADLQAEMAVLEWDERQRDSAPGQPDHLTDAMLYAWREATAWASPGVPHGPLPLADQWVTRYASPSLASVIAGDAEAD